MKNSTETFDRLRNAPLAVSFETVQNTAFEVLGEFTSAVLSFGGITYSAVDSYTMLRISRRHDLPILRGVPCEIQQMDIHLREAAGFIRQALSAGQTVLFSGTLVQTKILYETLIQNRAAIDNLLLCAIVQQFPSQYRLRQYPLGSMPWKLSRGLFWPADFILTDKSVLWGTREQKNTVIALRTPKARQMFDSVSDAFADYKTA